MPSIAIVDADAGEHVDPNELAPIVVEASAQVVACAPRTGPRTVVQALVMLDRHHTVSVCQALVVGAKAKNVASHHIASERRHAPPRPPRHVLCVCRN